MTAQKPNKEPVKKDVPPPSKKVENKMPEKKTKKLVKESKHNDSALFEWRKDIVIGTLNVIFLVGLFFLLSKIPANAKKLQVLNQNAFVVSTVTEEQLQQFDLEDNKENIEKIKAIFPDEDGVLDFVSEIEKLQDEGTVIGYSFVSKDPVSDKTKVQGFPVVIDMRGTWEDIGDDIQKIQKLPYLFRPVNIEALEDPEDNIVEFSYGGFIYVDESFKKNR